MLNVDQMLYVATDSSEADEISSKQAVDVESWIRDSWRPRNIAVNLGWILYFCDKLIFDINLVKLFVNICFNFLYYLICKLSNFLLFVFSLSPFA